MHARREFSLTSNWSYFNCRDMEIVIKQLDVPTENEIINFIKHKLQTIFAVT